MFAIQCAWTLFAGWSEGHPVSKISCSYNSQSSLLGTQTNYSVSQKNPPSWGFLTFFPKLLGIFGPNFICLLYVPIYTRLQNFIQLSATMTKLCHIKCDHPACVSTDGHFKHIPYILAYKSLPRINRKWFLRTCTESSRYTHNAF